MRRFASPGSSIEGTTTVSFNSKVAVTILAVASSALAPVAATAQDGGRLEVFGGIARDDRPLAGDDDGSSIGILPSVVFRPGGLTFQIDGIAADHLDDTVLGGAAHVMFAPSEQVGLGLYGSYAHTQFGGGLDVYRVGAEANYAAGRFTLTGIAGYEDAEDALVTVGSIPGFTVVDTYGHDGFFSMADVTFYPSDQWSVSAGHRHIGGRDAAAFSVERLVGLAGGNGSLFAEARAGDDDYAAAWLGFRVRFGGSDGSLATRDRAQGLQNRLKDDLFGLSNSRVRNQIANPVVVVPPPPPPQTCTGNSCYAT